MKKIMSVLVNKYTAAASFTLASASALAGGMGPVGSIVTSGGYGSWAVALLGIGAVAGIIWSVNSGDDDHFVAS